MIEEAFSEKLTWIPWYYACFLGKSAPPHPFFQRHYNNLTIWSCSFRNKFVSSHCCCRWKWLSSVFLVVNTTWLHNPITPAQIQKYKKTKKNNGEIHSVSTSLFNFFHLTVPLLLCWVYFTLVPPARLHLMARLWGIAAVPGQKTRRNSGRVVKEQVTCGMEGRYGE